MLKISYFLLLSIVLFHISHAKEAVCKLVDRSNGRIDGEVRFTQKDENSPTRVQGKVVNLNVRSLQGFHVHEKADFSNKCDSAGPHYNPYGKQHGAPDDSERHVGDMGNLGTDDLGNGQIDYEDRLISLYGEKTIVGRACVVHQMNDDLGRGDFPDSKTTGHAGARLACGEIVEVPEGSGFSTLLFLGAIGLGLYYYFGVRRRNRYMQMGNDTN
jgi:superoxide dismutase, Cu-Zn family